MKRANTSAVLWLSFVASTLVACTPPSRQTPTLPTPSAPTVEQVPTPLETQEQTPDTTQQAPVPTTPPPSSSPSSSPTPEKRTVKVEAGNWAFTPATITAKQGEELTIELVGISGTHGFASPDLGINVSVAAGETKTIVVPTDRTGTFRLFCSIPCGTGHKNMVGSIVIQP